MRNVFSYVDIDFHVKMQFFAILIETKIEYLVRNTVERAITLDVILYLRLRADQFSKLRDRQRGA